jgi:uncharacterized C2H2 Zn-finger protein
MVMCTFEGCKRTKGFSSTKDMLRHAAALHYGTVAKKIECPFAGCSTKFAIEAYMLKHLLRHGPAKILCTSDGCGKKFHEKSDMLKHLKRVHHKEMNVRCSECDRLFFDQKDMRMHVNAVHRGSKEHHCLAIGCDKSFSQGSKLKNHIKAVHDCVRDQPCTVPGCTQPPFSDRANMLKHIQVMHEGIKYPCKEPGCDLHSSSKSNMEIHWKRIHSVKGQQAKIKKQHVVHKLLKKHFAVDDECKIRYDGGLVQDPDKYCAYIDFHITDIKEFQHESYKLPCEQSRMVQVAESIQTAAKDETCPPIVFVRYNCDDARFNNVLQRNMTNRKEALIDLLKSIQEGTKVYTDPLNLVYINYDAHRNEAGELILKITRDPDFTMQGVVRDVIVVLDVDEEDKANDSEEE